MSDDLVLMIERHFAAPPERVFAAWTEPEQLAAWWGPEGATTPHYHLDVREGGKWETTMRLPDGSENTVSGVYREIDPPRRLVFTWAWHNDGVRGHETVVSLNFEASGGGTRMVLVQQTFQSADMRDKHRMGWTSSFNDLARQVEA